MDEKGVIPLAPPSMYPRSTNELEYDRSQSDRSQSDETRRKKRLRLFAYIAAFAVFQTVIILVFALVVMRVRTPDVKIAFVSVERLSVGPSSYNMTIIAQLKMKNKNFGDYKYERTTVYISQGGVTVGEGLIWNGKVDARDTETVVVTARVSSVALSSEASSGILVLEIKSALGGKVHLMKMWGVEFQFMKKRKGVEMNCVMGINLPSGVVQNVDCDE